MTRRLSDRARVYRDAILCALHHAETPLTATELVPFMPWEQQARAHLGVAGGRCCGLPAQHTSTSRLLSCDGVTDRLEVRPAGFQLAGFLEALARVGLVQQTDGTVDDRVVLWENTDSGHAVAAMVPAPVGVVA